MPFSPITEPTDVRAGKLDQRITLQRVARGKDSSGRPIERWDTVGDFWAEVQDMLPSRGERIAEGINVANRPARVRMRWRDDVTSSDRIVHQGRVMRIVTMPAELGRRDGIEFVAEEVQPQGQQP